MKPFNLEEFKAGKPALTRDGRIVYFEFENTRRPVTGGGRVVCTLENGDIHTVGLDGNYLTPVPGTVGDLVHMAPQKQKMYVGVLVYNNECMETTSAYRSESDLRNRTIIRDPRWQICDIEVDV